jgi:acyl-CoA dehydrogenase
LAIVLETEGLAGFRVGRRLEKLGQHASDTAELFFDSVRVPAEDLLGEKEGDGFVQLMSQPISDTTRLPASLVRTPPPAGWR